MDTLLAAIASRLSFDCPASLLERVASRYREPHRRYHTLAHVLACLEARRELTKSTLPEVDLALLFHDAVYEPLRSDNEARSALLLVEEGRRAWLHEPLLERAHPLIAATAHGRDDAIQSEEACIVVDADLSILGADEGAFSTYEEQVRAEYALVPSQAYAAGRRHVLEDFLRRRSIFTTFKGQRMWEGAARRNLERSLARLAS